MSSRVKMSYRDTRIIAVVLLVVTLYRLADIDAAVVRSEKFDEQLQRLTARAMRGPTSVRFPRAAEGSSEENTRYCHGAPCGWAVYDPATRNVEYFMKNTCECQDTSYKCVRVNDDLSASAYVYRCRQNTTMDDIESPEDTN